MSATASAISGGSTAHAEPYPQSSTGLGNEWFGMILFLVSEAVMFGSFFAQYFYNRVESSQWPPEGFERVPWGPLGVILTIVLALSGITAHNADTALKRDDQDGLRAWLATTIVLGLVFLGGQAYEYTNLIVNQGFTISSGIYGTIFFTLTGLHGLHVTGGVLVMCVVLARALMGHFGPQRRFGVQGAVLYWHFVDIVWFFLYAAVYVI